MIWPNSVMWSLYTSISSYSVLANSGVHIDLNEPVNSDPNRTPWVGLYLNQVALEPYRAMNNAQPFMANYEISVLCQEYSLVSAQEASDKLHRLISPVMTAIQSNDTLDSTVNIINGYTVTPFQRDINQDDNLFTDEILLTAEVDA